MYGRWNDVVTMFFWRRRHVGREYQVAKFEFELICTSVQMYFILYVLIGEKNVRKKKTFDILKSFIDKQ